jgi:[ribosomal protein S5]-alanine N-acetyltransferase
MEVFFMIHSLHNAVIIADRIVLFEQNLGMKSDIFKLLSDNEVVRFTEDKLVSSEKEIERQILNYKESQTFGYGKWAVLEKESGRFLGLCGIKRYETYGKNALSYAFLRKEWGKGYATEASLAVVNFAFKTLNFNELIAWTTPDNLASVRVLEKSGFNFTRKELWDLITWDLYTIKS